MVKRKYDSWASGKERTVETIIHADIGRKWVTLGRESGNRIKAVVQVPIEDYKKSKKFEDINKLFNDYLQLERY